MRLAFLLFVTACVGSGFGANPNLGRTVEKWDSNGKPKNIFTWYRSGNRNVKHGWDVFYFENGQMSRKYAWVKGKLNGPYQRWFSDGAVREQGKYVAGVQHGPWVIQYQDGTKARECTYYAGKVEGELKEWYANGKVRKTGFWSKGKPNGKFEQYGPDGKPTLKANYENGVRHGEIIHFYENGKEKSLFTYNQGRLDGALKRWHASGRVLADGIYKNGEPWDGVCWEAGDQDEHYYLYKYTEGELLDALYYSPSGPFTGVVSEWHPEGVRSRECEYENGRKNGSERWFFPDSKPAAICSWKDNKLTGKYIEWYRSGAKKSELTLADGKLEGPAIQWDVRGQEVARGENRGDLPWSGILLVAPQDGSEPFLQEFKDGRPVNVSGNVSSLRRPSGNNGLGPRRPDADVADPNANAPGPFIGPAPQPDAP